jgi:hypothetical protein
MFAAAMKNLIMVTGGFLITLDHSGEGGRVAGEVAHHEGDEDGRRVVAGDENGHGIVHDLLVRHPLPAVFVAEASEAAEEVVRRSSLAFFSCSVASSILRALALALRLLRNAVNGRSSGTDHIPSCMWAKPPRARPNSSVAMMSNASCFISGSTVTVARLRHSASRWRVTSSSIVATYRRSESGLRNFIIAPRRRRWSSPSSSRTLRQPRISVMHRGCFGASALLPSTSLFAAGPVTNTVRAPNSDRFDTAPYRSIRSRSHRSTVLLRIARSRPRLCPITGRPSEPGRSFAENGFLVLVTKYTSTSVSKGARLREEQRRWRPSLSSFYTARWFVLRV